MKHEFMTESPEILKEFIMYMETIKGKSSKTVEEYFLDLRMFFRFMILEKLEKSNSDDFNSISIKQIDMSFVSEIKLIDVYAFLDFVMRERGVESAGRARKVSSIRSFFKYITQKKGYLKVNPVLELDTPKIKKTLPKHLTLDESVELLDSVDGQFKERDYCILTLFLNCGLRLAELISINLSDIRPDHTLKVIGKGNKERMVYLNDACVNAVDAYMKVRHIDGVDDKNALFLSRNKNRISRRAVQNIVEKNLGKIALSGQGYSTHKLRHTAATLMYQHGGVDVRVLKDILGHENLNTTQIYTHLSDVQMKDATESNPLAKIKQKKTSKKPEIDE